MTKKLKLMKFLLIFLLSIPCFAYSQEPLKYSEVIEAPSTTKDELFVRAREWFNEKFNSSKDVLQITDKETGELSGKGNMEVEYEIKYLGVHKDFSDINFSMSIWVKDGKYKYEMSNFISSQNNKFSFGPITTSDKTDRTFKGVSQDRLNNAYIILKENTILKAQLLIEDMKFKMNQKSKTTNW